MLTYFVPYSFGGSADYSLCQIRALARLGLDINLVAPKLFRDKLLDIDFRPYTELIDRRPRKLPKPLRAAVFMKEMVDVHHTLARHLDDAPSEYVLMGDFGEYMAPLWEPALRSRKKQRGLRFGCILHDPVRNLVRGPKWWHDLSLSKAFSLFDDVYLHGPPPTRLIDSVPGVSFVQIPHGVFSGDVPVPSREDARRALKLPADALVFLQFGHVRDNKNLDLIIEALALTEGAHLVVAGEVTSGTQRSEEFYKDLVERLGLQSRVHFRFGFVRAEDIPLLFAAVDGVCLLYAKSFKSMSGVLAHAITYRTPVMASGGDGPLAAIVQRYGLGVWLDNLGASAIADAMASGARRSIPDSDWRRCSEECSWKRNAELVAAQIRA